MPGPGREQPHRVLGDPSTRLRVAVSLSNGEKPWSRQTPPPFGGLRAFWACRRTRPAGRPVRGHPLDAACVELLTLARRALL